MTIAETMLFSLALSAVVIGALWLHDRRILERAIDVIVTRSRTLADRMRTEAASDD